MVTESKLVKKIPLEQVKQVEIYIFSTGLAKRYRCLGAKNFFEHCLDNLDNQVFHQPVFLSKQAAFQHARFIDDRHLLLKAYVPEYFIEGHPQALVLRPQLLAKQHIHGSFLGWIKGNKYLINPWFGIAEPASATA